MRVRVIHIENFMSHDETRLELPATGAAVVTGANGSGKSSIVEAAAWCFWGKTVRGADPTRLDNSTALVAVLTDTVRVVRQRRRGKPATLRWSAVDPAEAAAMRVEQLLSASPQWANATKAQEALDAVIGSFDDWRRTHVFSADDATRFTRATDGERKRFLEAMLGLECFDPALAACRVDLKQARSVFAVADREVARAGARLTAAQETLESAEKSTPVSVPVSQAKPATRAQVDAVKGVLVLAQGDLDEARLRLRDRTLVRKASDAAATARASKATFAKLEHGECPLCGNELSADYINELHKDAEACLHEARKVREHVAAEQKLLDQDHDAALADVSELQAQLQALQVAVGDADRQAAAVANAQTHVDGCRAAVDAWTAKAATRNADLVQAALEVGTLVAVERVLGLRGVRAHLVGQTLDALATATSVWLKRLGMLQLSVRMVVSQGKRGAAPTIALEIVGAGGGDGYKGASGGERRRVDIAFLLALAGIRNDGEPGTLWFDEVLDRPLDDAGVIATVPVIAELTANRSAIVITHEPELAEQLHAVARWTVTAGVVA